MTMPKWFPQSPKQVWDHFYDLTQIPRPSKKEDKVVDHLVNLAKKYELKYKVDEEKNVIIYVPGSKGLEDREAVIIQAHTDMVTDATTDRVINFEDDPIITMLDGDWLTADRTTLGADNGIGCAFAMACITDKSLIHPPLELLFTADEETGLNGAWAVKSEDFKGRKLINIDTEEWGSLYVGCAGGIDYDFNGHFVTSKAKTKEFYKISLDGLSGGHSGLDIHLQLGNGIKILNEFLYRFSQKNDLEIFEFRGGKAHNIIPRDAWAIIGVNDFEKLIYFLDDYTEGLFSFLPKRDHELEFSIEKIDEVDKCLNTEETKKFLSLMTLFPHGAHSYEWPLKKELVASSNNLAKTLMIKGEFYAQTSLRFFDREEIKKCEDKLYGLASLFNMKIAHNSEYPSWKPIWETPLLEAMKKSYSDLFKEEAKVKAIHAGLECGILKDRISKDLDAISFGPNITGAHSPDEKVHIPTVDKSWLLFKDVLSRL